MSKISVKLRSIVKEAFDYIESTADGEVEINRTKSNNGEFIDITANLAGKISKINIETNAKITNMTCTHPDCDCKEIWNAGKVIGKEVLCLDYRRMKNDNSEKILMSISDNHFSLIKTVVGKQGDIIENKIIVG